MNTTKKCKKVNFEGQVFSVGLDVHSKSWSVSVVTNGVMLKTFSAEPDDRKLLQTLNNNYPGGIFHFCYEAGFCGFWIQRALSINKNNCIVVNPADIPSSQKDKVTKNDTVDSRKIARELDNKNSLKPIYIPNYEEEAYRDLSRYRSSLIKKQTVLKEQLKAFLHRYNIQIPEKFKGNKWSKKFIEWLKEVYFPHYYSKLAFAEYIKDLEFIAQKVINTTKKLLNIIQNDSELSDKYRIIKSTPGIGVICTIVLIAEIWDINRFKDTNRFCSYIGFIPTSKDTGGKMKSRGITFRHKNKLRNLLIEAAWVAIKYDPILLQRFIELNKRMPKNKAIVRVAKKLIRKLFYIWKNKEIYVNAVA